MMHRGLVIACCLVVAQAVAGDERLSFNRDVRPILSENCFHCHGADAAQRQADLRLDDRAVAVELGAIVPGEAEASSLVERITSDDPELKMPPADSERRLTAEQIDVLKRWIAEGAEYEAHWAFQPVKRPSEPAIRKTDWPRNAIDRFVLERLEREELTPSSRAPLPALLRRVALDVTGLPATPGQLASWQTASDPVAAALDELLASLHYGERMAVDWLDVARYADTHGFNNDSLRSMWRWRDWVVDAFNANMPYDAFLTKQLAGDLLPDASVDDRLATGFNRNHVINSEGGIIDEEYRVEYVADRVRTTSLAWLGLTLECARCHDHKFDPVAQREYYQMFAFFNNVDETGEDGRVGNAAPLMRVPTKEQSRRLEELLATEESLERELRQELESVEAIEVSTPPPPEFVEKQISLAVADEPVLLPAEKPMDAASKEFDLGGGWLFAAWVKRGGDSAGPLVSTMNFAVPRSSGGYGDGMQIGLTAMGTVDVRLAVRWPAYALNVRSKASVPEGQWAHVAVTGRGNKSEGFRIFIDGVEVDTDVRHDDLTGNVKLGKSVRVGHSGESDGNLFRGEIHRLRLVTGHVEGASLEALLHHAMLTQHTDDELADEGFGRKVAALGVNEQADDRLAKLCSKWKAARGERLTHVRTFPTVMVMRDLPEGRNAFVLERGQYDKPGENVTPDVPAALGLPLPQDGPRDRRALAKWLTDPRHPLTARVVVNRLWQSFFGVGLVKTVEDFGVQGEWPSHPELLDWLAADFVENRWDVKRLVRMIVESATYQQDSAASADLWARDPENRLLARGPRQRLAAEMIRDQALAVSGLLVPKLGGPPVFPYQPADLYKGIVVEAGYPGTKYEQSTGEDLYRRSLYTFWKRTVPHPTLTTFDALDREFCAARRSVTNTPLQALALMNDPTFLEAGLKLGDRMLVEGGETDEARLAFGFELLTARKPETNELAPLLKLLEAQRREFASAGAPKGLLTAGESKPEGPHTDAERAAYASVGGLLLNLDEAITRN
jgi:hypothetical protein